MAETAALVETLKAALKTGGHTYADVAEVLHLSEPTVKQMFSARRLSLGRLDRICEGLLKIEISDLVALMQAREPQLTALTEHQELQLVADKRLLLVAVSVMNGWRPAEISTVYVIDDNECRRHLSVLEGLQLIRMRPDGEIRLRVARNFDWLPNGPIQRYFQGHIQHDFLGADFDRAGEKLLFVTGALSARSAQQLIARIDRLAEEFKALNDGDVSLPLRERVGASMVIAYRPWIMAAFTELRRDPDVGAAGLGVGVPGIDDSGTPIQSKEQ